MFNNHSLKKAMTEKKEKTEKKSIDNFKKKKVDGEKVKGGAISVDFSNDSDPSSSQRPSNGNSDGKKM